MPDLKKKIFIAGNYEDSSLEEIITYLREEGFEIFTGSPEDNIPVNTDLVIFGKELSDHPELRNDKYINIASLLLVECKH